MEKDMAGERVQLIGAWFSPFVRKVMWALEIKGIEYDYIEEDLLNKSPLLLQSNPVHKKVPVLIHRGKPIVESLVILEYIDDVWKNNPLLPSDPHERANARFWAKFVNNEFSENLRQVLHQSGERQKMEIEKTKAALENLERELAGGKKFFGGDRIGLVDIVFGSSPYWLNALEEAAGAKVFDAAKFPLITQWMKRMLENPVIGESLPPKEQLVQGLKMVRKVNGPRTNGKN